MIVLRCAFINARYVLLIILTGGRKVCTSTRDFPICYLFLSFSRKGVPLLLRCVSVTYLIQEIEERHDTGTRKKKTFEIECNL